MFTYYELISSLISLCNHHSSFLHHSHYPIVQTCSYFIVQTIYIYSIFVFNFHMIENVSLVYLILININFEVSIIDVIYVYIIYHNLVTEMQAAVAIISVSRSIYNKLSFHCHVIYISKIKVFVFVFVFVFVLVFVI